MLFGKELNLTIAPPFLSILKNIIDDVMQPSNFNAYMNKYDQIKQIHKRYMCVNYGMCAHSCHLYMHDNLLNFTQSHHTHSRLKPVEVTSY